MIASAQDSFKNACWKVTRGRAPRELFMAPRRPHFRKCYEPLSFASLGSLPAASKLSSRPFISFQTMCFLFTPNELNTALWTSFVILHLTLQNIFHLACSVETYNRNCLVISRICLNLPSRREVLKRYHYCVNEKKHPKKTARESRFEVINWINAGEKYTRTSLAICPACWLRR